MTLKAPPLGGPATPRSAPPIVPDVPRAEPQPDAATLLFNRKARLFNDSLDCQYLFNELREIEGKYATAFTRHAQEKLAVASAKAAVIEAESLLVGTGSNETERKRSLAEVKKNDAFYQEATKTLRDAELELVNAEVNLEGIKRQMTAINLQITYRTGVLHFFSG